MSPLFLLHLSTDSIALDQESEAGAWVRLGAAKPDDPKLADALAHLKALACPEALVPVDVLIALPPDHLKTLSIEKSDMAHADVIAAMDGRTPYDVLDLCLDWCNSTQGTAVAAILRDNLDEAASFAEDFGFRAVEFVALPGGIWGNNFAVFKHGEQSWDRPVLRMKPYTRAPKSEQSATITPNLPVSSFATTTHSPEKIAGLTLKPYPASKPTRVVASPSGHVTPPSSSLQTKSSVTAPFIGSATKAPHLDTTVTPELMSFPNMTVQTTKSWPKEPERPLVSQKPNKFQAFMSKFLRRNDTETDRLINFKIPISSIQADVGGKPRYLGIILTTLLLIFILTVAAWAATAGTDTVARWFGLGKTETEITTKAVSNQPTIELTASLQEDLAQDVTQIFSTPITVQELPPDTTSVEVKIPTTTVETIAPDDLIVGRKFILEPDPIALTEQTTFKTEVETVPSASAPANIAMANTDVSLNREAEAASIRDFQNLIQTEPDTLSASSTTEVDATSLLTQAELKQDTGSNLELQIEVNNTPLDISENFEISLQGRPRVRPATADLEFKTVSLSEMSQNKLALFRPIMRPILPQKNQVVDLFAVTLPIPTSRRPEKRPLSIEITARVPEQASALPLEVQSPTVSSEKSVTKAATVKNALNLSDINLIGISGPKRNPNALVRLANGKILKVKVGDRLNGGRVTDIRMTALTYTISGRSYILSMPRN